MINLFGWLGGIFVRLFKAAKHNGLTDALMKEACAVVKDAVGMFADNAQRREWAVQVIVRRFGVPESIARFAVEAAVQLLKHEQKNKPVAPVSGQP